jgi:hypothetical protein
MTRREAARALRDTLREFTHAAEAATKFANHAMGLALTFRHDLVPSTSITRETAILLHHASENLIRLVSARPARSAVKARSRRRRKNP